MRWQVTEKSFIVEHIREPGEIVEYTPPPGTRIASNLKPADDEARAYVVAFDQDAAAAAA